MILQLSNNKAYRLNIDKIIGYCTVSQDDKATQKDITELYRDGFDGMQLVQRQINETKISNGSQLKSADSLKYDLIKVLLEMLFHMGVRQGEQGNVQKYVDIEDNISIGETIGWNTLIAMGFLEEI